MAHEIREAEACIAAGKTQSDKWPLSATLKVMELMDSLTAKITAEGEEEAKAFKEYFEWCANDLPSPLPLPSLSTGG